MHLSKKAKKSLDSLLEFWRLETDIPVQVSVQQFTAEVLGTLRCQQQVARLPATVTLKLQKDFEHEVRRMISLGQPPPGEYLRAPPPRGLGLGSIELSGAVDFLAGMGQVRWALPQHKHMILGEIRRQIRAAGLCTRV